MKQYVIIVDGYKFSRDFVDAVHACGLDCLHVFSTKENIPVMEASTTYHPADYHANYRFTGDFSALINQLQRYSITAVIPSTEPGVLLADQLAYHFRCPHNEMGHSEARRDKYLMLLAVQRAGLPVPKFINANDLEKVETWIQRQQSYPIVIKPRSEAATFGVYIARNEAQLAQAWTKLNSIDSLLQQKTRKILAEEFLQGEEYVVNTLTHHGKHYVSDIWRYHKVYTDAGYCRYDKTILQLSNFQNKQTLINYVFAVLDALGIKFGISHCEVMLTQVGPRLIEIGARVSGLHDKALWERCLGYNEVELCVSSYLKQEYDFSFLIDKKVIKENALLITLANDKTGIVKSLPALEPIKKRLSYYNHKIYYKLNQFVQPTTSSIDSPGRIFLVHKEMDVILEDYDFIKKFYQKKLIIKDKS